MRESDTSVIDLFCGCGGLGLGAELSGFRALAAVDIDETLQSAYRLNFPQATVFKADIAVIDAAAWRFMLNGKRPDGIVGGPPCQGFSRIGKRNREDPRNTLIGHYFRHIKLLRPKFFLMENVEGLLDAGNIECLMEALDGLANEYSVIGPMIVDASEYGAPTKRKRVVVVGYRPDEVDPITAADLAPAKGTKAVTVHDAIFDLPEPEMVPAGKQNHIWKRYPVVDGDDKTLSAYAKKMRRMPTMEIGWQHSLEKLAHGYLSGFADTSHSLKVEERFADTTPGTVEPVSRYPRLMWSGLCPTLRAGTGSDRGSFQAMRPIHPTSPRVITVREAARLQGFPDWFTFHPAKWHSFRMIGNSVSPIVSQALLTIIKSKMSQNIDSVQAVV